MNTTNEVCYIDKYGQYHVKPCVDGEPSTNDGFIITAYAAKAGLPVDRDKLQKMYDQLKKVGDMPVERLPGKETPYLSRDVILGLHFLGLITDDWLKDHNYNFSPFSLPRLKPFKVIRQFWSLRNQHRNTFWKNKLDQVYRFAFIVPLQDRRVKWIEWFDKKISGKNDSSKLIRWLKYDQMPEREVFERYCGKDHPITKQIHLLKSPSLRGASCVQTLDLRLLGTLRDHYFRSGDHR